MIIDSLYEGVIAKLTAQKQIMPVSEHLRALDNNNDRVLYLYKLLDGLKAFPNILEVRKTDSMSIHYRNLGNKCFKAYDNYRAWQYYNLSLLYSPLDSECYILALANRSAVFHVLEKYTECLHDVNTVLSMNYPETLKSKLSKRVESCEMHLLANVFIKEEDDNNIDLTLKESQVPRFACASPKLEVVFSKEMGRHVVAKSDIKVGEILVQEEPYFKLLIKSQYLFACAYCLSRNLNLLPCPNCCFVLYCSEQCKENAHREYHSVECPLMATIIDMEFTKLEFLALRTVIKARNDHPDWNSLFRTIEEAELNKDTEYQGHAKVNGEWVYDAKYYVSIHTLESNVDKRSVSDIFQKAVTAAVFLWLLNEKTSFLKSGNDEEETDIKECVAGLLLLHIMTSPTNMHGISANIQNAGGNYVDELSIASAAYPFHSLLNHSCAPNVVRFNKLGTGQMSLIALRPIKKGMQIYDNYGPHHALEDRISRVHHLKFQYKFICSCEACINDWPIYLMMRQNSFVPEKLRAFKNKFLNSNAIEQLQRGDRKTAEEKYKLLCSLAEKLEPYMPCVELADCQESIKQCLQILQGLVPYGYSQQVKWTARPPKV